MRAGQLDRVIQIQDVLDVTVDEYGTTTRTFQKVRVRAQMLQYDTSNREGIRPSTEITITFRIYWIEGVTLESRVLYDGQVYKIQRIREVGRRFGLEIVCERIGL
jgi:SPP1 family predicted phage head-tail adaptor